VSGDRDRDAQSSNAWTPRYLSASTTMSVTARLTPFTTPISLRNQDSIDRLPDARVRGVPVPNSHAVPVLLDQEVSALKSRLAEATIALDRIEATVVAIDKDAPAEVHALAATVLAQVLSSADHDRPKQSGFVHDWEREAYAAYEAGGRRTAGPTALRVC